MVEVLESTLKKTKGVLLPLISGGIAIGCFLPPLAPSGILKYA
jgi:hypothetical protein